MGLDVVEGTPLAVKDTRESDGPDTRGEAVMMNWKLDADTSYQLLFEMRYVCTMLDLVGLLGTRLYLLLSLLIITARGYRKSTWHRIKPHIENSFICGKMEVSLFLLPR